MYRGALLQLDAANRRHPLLAGCIGWWLGMPGRGGGGDWYGLIRGGKGTNSGSPSWLGNSRPGRLGVCPTYSGTQYTDCSVIDGSVSGLATLTIAAWVNRASGARQLIGRGYASSARACIDLFTDNVLYFEMGTQYDTGPSVGAGWQHIAVTFNGASSPRTRYYLNGSASAPTANAITGTTIPTTTGFAVNKAGTSDTYLYGAGGYDDVTVWGRVLSDVELRAWYEQSRRGHPETLQRNRSAVFSLPSAIASLAATLGGVLLSGTGSSVDPSPAAGSLTSGPAAVTISSSGAATSPAPATASLTTSLDAIGITASGTAGAAGVATGSLTVTIGAFTLAGAGGTDQGLSVPGRASLVVSVNTVTLRISVVGSGAIEVL